MEITLNGERRDVPDAATLQELLDSLRLSTQGGIAVLLNGEISRRGEWAATGLRPEDELEIVRATVGG